MVPQDPDQESSGHDIDDVVLEQQQEAPVKIVKARIRRGQTFVQDGDALEAVTLSATESKILFLQRPRRIIVDEQNGRNEKSTADVQRMNQIYQEQVQYNQTHQNQASVETQTLNPVMFDESVGQQMVKEVDSGVQASFLDIVQTNGGINTDDDLNQT